MKSELQATYFGDQDATVHATLDLARRQNGGVLDDSAISAVSEALDLPEDYVRSVAALDVQQEQIGLAGKMRATFLGLNSDTRRVVTAGFLASLCGAVWAISALWHILVGMANVPDLGPLFDVFKLVIFVFGLYNVSISKDIRSAVVTGATFVSFTFAVHTIFLGLFRVPHSEVFLMIPIGAAGALVGGILFKFVGKNREALGLKDKVEERKHLLKQLVDIQEQLKSAEQSMTFLSVDIVGSSKMKEGSDPLGVEYTFGEFHTYIEAITRRYGGRVHSTAGDGVTCAFESPHAAYGAARNMQAGLLELNTHRNKIGKPIRLRAGVHSGKVMAPDARDITTLNFAHVIDIAAHLQKVCPTGCIVVSMTTAMDIPGGANTIGAERIETPDTTAVIWKPRVLPQESLPARTPPAGESLN